MKISTFAIVFSLLSAGCASHKSYIGGTTVLDTEDNRAIIAVVEKYRLAVERKDAPALLNMASKSYWEDGGTPTGADDYGYDGLREVLVGRFQRSDEIRYSMKYLKVRRHGNRVSVDVMIDASYTVAGPQGEERKDKRDRNELILEWNGEDWQFVAGM